VDVVEWGAFMVLECGILGVRTPSWDPMTHRRNLVGSLKSSRGICLSLSHFHTHVAISDSEYDSACFDDFIALAGRLLLGRPRVVDVRAQRVQYTRCGRFGCSVDCSP
jgi:hypothetical protein